MESNVLEKWTTPDEDGNIHIPDELVDLVNSIGMQINFMHLSGKSEVQTIVDIAFIAQEYFKELNLKNHAEYEKSIR
jgi:hypothetical protein